MTNKIVVKNNYKLKIRKLKKNNRKEKTMHKAATPVLWNDDNLRENRWYRE